MTDERVLEICREELPQHSDDGYGYILWNHTGYPHFWTGDPEECLRNQLRNYRDGSGEAEGTNDTD